jgi:hypothetical protein
MHVQMCVYGLSCCPFGHDIDRACYYYCKWYVSVKWICFAYIHPPTYKTSKHATCTCPQPWSIESRIQPAGSSQEFCFCALFQLVSALQLQNPYTRAMSKAINMKPAFVIFFGGPFYGDGTLPPPSPSMV